MRSERRTLCNRDCPDVCGIVATVEEGRVVQLAGDKDHPITRGFLCHRTSRFLARQYDPARLAQPLFRRGEGFVPIPWDEALDLAADRLTAIKRESGAAAILHYRCGGSLGLLKHLTDYFFERFGPVTTKRGDICSGAGDAAQMLDFGEEDSHDTDDLANARHILLWGKNPYVSSPHLVPILREARRRGTRITLIDPVHHRSTVLCDRIIQPRPAGDFDLAMAVLAILFREGWIDPAAASYCDHLEALRALAASRGVADWCAAADVAPAEAEHLARALGVERPAAILVGWGMGRRTIGAAIVRALDALAAVSGNLGVPGGGVSFYFKRRGAFDLSFIRGEAAAPRTLPEPLLGQSILDAKDPPIRAAWITAGNPVVMLPASATTARALATRDFVVVVDTWMSDTARLAHLVLPTTTLLESDDLVGSYGHPYIGAVRPVVSPPEGCRSDLAIAQGLAARVGLASEMAGTARQWQARLLRRELVEAGVTVEKLESLPAVRNPLAPRVLFADCKFPTPTGRVNLLHEEPARDPPEPGDFDFPLFLMSLSTEDAQCSQWVSPQPAPAVVTLHPEAAGGLPDGAIARLESRAGSLVVRLHHDPRQRRDVALVPKGGHLSTGQAANALVRARLTDLGEGGALYDERVRIAPIP